MGGRRVAAFAGGHEAGGTARSSRGWGAGESLLLFVGWPLVGPQPHQQGSTQPLTCGLQQPSEQVSGLDDVNATEAAQLEQVTVSADNDVSTPARGAGQELVVVRIATHRRR